MYERLPDGSIGPVIPDVRVVFTSENGRVVKTTKSNSAGFYRVALIAGRYWVVAAGKGYQTYSTIPGFSVVRGFGYKTFNIFLKKVKGVTVLLVRHAEADYPSDPINPALTTAGQARTQKLVHVAEKAGVSAVYATEFQRTQLTVEPLATALGLTVQQYTSTDTEGIVDQVLDNHDGETVLIAGHSHTVPQIINEFGGQLPAATVTDFDNLFVVTYNTGVVEVVNLQYGASSP